MLNLKNKTIIVTGSSSGLGKQIALELAKTGANLVINYNSSATEAQRVVEEIKANNGSAIAVKANVSKNDDVIHLFDTAKASFGKVDMIINKAGIMTTKLLKDSSEEDFDQQFAVNVKSVFLMMKAAAERLETNGRIINISSSTTKMMMPTYGIYSATKAAVEQMTKVFAKEVGSKGITVNAVLPGPLKTKLFLEGKSEELVNRIASLSAFNRIANVDDISPIISFLCSDESAWLTGQCIAVNGGMA